MAEDTQGWRRAGRRIVLLGVLPALAVLAGLGWWAISGRYITTENAYVKASIVAISATSSGIPSKCPKPCRLPRSTGRPTCDWSADTGSDKH